MPSARAEITFPRADRDLLIFFASSSTAPSAPVLLTYQGIKGQVCHEPLQRERALTTSLYRGAQPKEGRGHGKRTENREGPCSIPLNSFAKDHPLPPTCYTYYMIPLWEMSRKGKPIKKKVGYPYEELRVIGIVKKCIPTSS